MTSLESGSCARWTSRPTGFWKRQSMGSFKPASSVRTVPSLRCRIPQGERKHLGPGRKEVLKYQVGPSTLLQTHVMRRGRKSSHLMRTLRVIFGAWTFIIQTFGSFWRRAEDAAAWSILVCLAPLAGCAGSSALPKEARSRLKLFGSLVDQQAGRRKNERRKLHASQQRGSRERRETESNSVGGRWPGGLLSCTFSLVRPSFNESDLIICSTRKTVSPDSGHSAGSSHVKQVTYKGCCQMLLLFSLQPNWANSRVVHRALMRASTPLATPKCAASVSVGRSVWLASWPTVPQIQVQPFSSSNRMYIHRGFSWTFAA
jgi:hypothetical protein